MTRLLTGDYVNDTYTKSFNNSISYLYIGFTFNKLVGNDNILNFNEIQLFGKELNNFQSDWNSTIINKPDLTVYATNTNLNSLSSQSYFLTNYTNLSLLNVSGTTRLNNAATINSSLNVSGTTTLSNNTIINGIANIHSGSPFAVPNNYMQKGSLTIGDVYLNYGGGVSGWNTNTSGLMLECLNNTEIAVFDAGQRVSSLMYYEGAGINKITIGRNMGWTTISNLVLNGNVSCTARLNISGDTTLNNITTINSSLNVSGTTTLNNATTINSSLNVSGITTLNNTTTIVSSLNVSGTTTLNNNTTLLSSLNVVGNIIGSGTALTNLNYNAILNPPSIVNFNNPSTFISTLNVSGNTTLNNTTWIIIKCIRNNNIEW
jgi:trimeric autotransporter adhesin